MPLPTPDADALHAVADGYRLGLSPADAESFRPFVAALLESWDTVERLYAERAPSAPERPWRRPEPADNPYNAWYVTTDLAGDAPGGVGPLAGERVAVKDNIAVAGLPLMNGSRTVEGFTPRRDATVVTRVLEAGGRILGKAACEDLCFSGGSHTSRTGPVRNPWDEARTTGGSSSGNAALLAGGLVDLAVGGDQGGSVRIPASFTGIVGHKPTHGLVPYTGAFPIEQTIDHLGPMARTVDDVAALLGVLAGVDGQDPRQPTTLEPVDYPAALDIGAEGLRIGVLAEGFALPNADPGVNAAVREAVGRLAGAGLEAEEVSLPWHTHGARIWDVIGVEGTAAQMLEYNGYGVNWSGAYDPELVEHYGRTWRAAPGEFSETVKLLLLAAGFSRQRRFGAHYAMARELVPALRAGYDEALARYDVLVLPTTPITASVLPAEGADRAEVLGRALEMVANTCPTDVTGHPACSVPAGLADGLPVGMMIIGRRFEDATVLRVAAAWERLAGGFPSPPGVTLPGMAAASER